MKYFYFKEPIQRWDNIYKKFFKYYLSNSLLKTKEEFIEYINNLLKKSHYELLTEEEIKTIDEQDIPEYDFYIVYNMSEYSFPKSCKYFKNLEEAKKYKEENHYEEIEGKYFN